ncbi:MAG: DUF58 domain-containing protein [Planctomycetota bacterium]|jgi:uncharacterized protein (DUF58 family)
MARTRATSKYLDPAVLAEISRLDLRARQVVEGYVSGLHKSPRKGYSVEFAEHREYVPGDDIRHIDWKLWGREDRWYIKQYEEETNLRCHLLLDISESMRFGTGPLNKFEYSATAAAGMAFLLLKQRDAVGIRLFDDHLRETVPLSSNWHALHNILTVCEETAPKKKTEFAQTLADFAEHAGRRSMVVIFSDLFTDPAELERGLQILKHKRHEVLLLNVLDETEITFPFEDNTKFLGLEEMPDLIAEPRALRDGYLEVLQEHLDAVRRICASMRIDFVLLSTGDRLDKALSGFLAARARFVRSSTRRG